MKVNSNCSNNMNHSGYSSGENLSIAVAGCYVIAKRLIDILGGVVGLLVFGLPMLLIALVIKLTSPGPVIFVQARVGKGGKVFGMYKFRSMVDHAEEVLYRNPKLWERYQKGSYKLKSNEDPRVTRLGRFLRKWSLDELPQFLNVLEGEMSLVGPRAYKPDELEEQQRRHPGTAYYVKWLLTIKPGLTGPWQVTGRSEIPFKERVKIDAEYAQKRSLRDDLKIILKTPLAVVRCKGAY